MFFRNHKLRNTILYRNSKRSGCFQTSSCLLPLEFTTRRRPLPRNDPRAMAQIIRQCTPKATSFAVSENAFTEHHDLEIHEIIYRKTTPIHFTILTFVKIWISEFWQNFWGFESCGSFVETFEIIETSFRSVLRSGNFCFEVVDTAHLHGALGGFKRLGLTKFAEDAKAQMKCSHVFF